MHAMTFICLNYDILIRFYYSDLHSFPLATNTLQITRIICHKLKKRASTSISSNFTERQTNNIIIVYMLIGQKNLHQIIGIFILSRILENHFYPLKVTDVKTDGRADRHFELQSSFANKKILVCVCVLV